MTATSPKRTMPTEAFDSYHYDPAHVLPFLTNLLFSYLRDVGLGWCGIRADMLDLVCRAWRCLGFTRPILVDAAGARARPDGTCPDVRITGREDWLRPQSSWYSNLAARPAAVRRAFLAAVAHERRRLFAAPDAPPRRFIGVNAATIEWMSCLPGTSASPAPLSARVCGTGLSWPATTRPAMH